MVKSRAGQDIPAEAVDLRSSVEAGQERVKASQRNMQESHQKLRDLTLNIRLKEELIRELAKTSKDSEAANKKYSNKIKQLEKDAQKARQELVEARRHLHDLGSKGEMETKEKNKLEDEYQKKMEKAHSKVKELMKKQQESERVLKLQTQREKKIEDLEINVGRMKQHQELLQARLREEGERKLKLERDLQRDQQRIKELEIKNEQQQKILKRKTEEVAAAQRKLRVGSGHTADHDKIEEQRKWLDTEVEKVLQRKKKMKELEEELKKREMNLAKKELMLRERGELEMKKLRSSQSISRDMTGLASQLQSVEKEIEEKSNTLRVSLDAQKPVIGKEMQGLKAERERLLQQRIQLDGKLQDGTLLSATEERRLIELDEGVEALEAAIEYKNDIISTKKKELRKNDLTQSEAMLMSRLNSLAPNETKSLLAKYFEKVIDLREGDRRKELEISELEMKLDERERVIRTLEGSLRSAGMESEQRLIEQQKDYEKKVQVLMRELQGEGGGGDGGFALEHKLKELEKDLFYYKKTSRELKKKLREFVQASTSSSNGHEDAKGHQSARGIPAHGGDAVPREATPVRKSRREVRELSEAEVSLRKSSASQRSSMIVDSIESGASHGNNPWN
nr:kinesin-like protein kif7 [Lytechinus pictus]